MLLRFVAAVALVISVLIGCDGKFTEISSQEFRLIWEESQKDSAVSWWYLGDKGGFHYFVEKKPLGNTRYAVPASSLNIKGGKQFAFTRDERQWINLKTTHFDF